MPTFYYFRDVASSSRYNASLRPSCDRYGSFREEKFTSFEEEWSTRRNNLNSGTCIFCDGIKLLSWKNCKDTEESIYSYDLSICPVCGWWKLKETSELKYVSGYDAAETFLEYFRHARDHYAILDTFDLSEDAAPLDEVSKILLNDWKYSKNISPKKAQDLVLNVFKNHMNCDVYYYDDAVYAPDGGIDFVLVQTDNRKLAFQVKRRQTDNNESISPVREFIGAIASSPFNEGFYVTTAPRFTDYALTEMDGSEINLADKNVKVSLVDGSRLRNLLELHKPNDKCAAALGRIAPKLGWNSRTLRRDELNVSEVFNETQKCRT